MTTWILLLFIIPFMVCIYSLVRQVSRLENKFARLLEIHLDLLREYKSIQIPAPVMSMSEQATIEEMLEQRGRTDEFVG